MVVSSTLIDTALLLHISHWHARQPVPRHQATNMDLGKEGDWGLQVKGEIWATNGL